MLVYPSINPVALQIGSVKVHWYGIMYMLGFLFFIYAGKYRIKKYHPEFWCPKFVDDMMFYGALGVILGGRLGYCLFYQPILYLTNPILILKIWQGGMSFHGGMLGVFCVIYGFAKYHKQSFFVISDFIAPLVPFGLLCGRLGNFINGELWGRLANNINLPWVMIFPQSNSMLPRHPSQLYEAFGEGLLLFIILWIFAHKPRKTGQVSAIFLISYGIIRFIIEYFRQPDTFLLHFATITGLSMGQWLCMPMIICGIIIYIKSIQQKF